MFGILVIVNISISMEVTSLRQKCREIICNKLTIIRFVMAEYETDFWLFIIKSPVSKRGWDDGVGG